MLASTNTAISAVQLARFAATLREQRRFRTAQIRTLRSSQCRNQYDPNEEIRRTILTGAITALADTDAALARIAEGSYGHCTDCAKPLLIDQLEARPQAPRCTDCEWWRS